MYVCITEANTLLLYPATYRSCSIHSTYLGYGVIGHLGYGVIICWLLLYPARYIACIIHMIYVDIGMLHYTLY